MKKAAYLVSIVPCVIGLLLIVINPVIALLWSAGFALAFYYMLSPSRNLNRGTLPTGKYGSEFGGGNEKEMREYLSRRSVTIPLISCLIMVLIALGAIAMDWPGVIPLP